MKNDKFCFSKTLTYLVLLVAVVAGTFLFINYTNTQKLTTNSEATGNKRNATDDADCRSKTGDNKSYCTVARCLNLATGTSIDKSKVDLTKYDCAKDGVLKQFAGRCCLGTSGYKVPTPVPYKQTINTGTAPQSQTTAQYCLSKVNEISGLPRNKDGKVEQLRYNDITSYYYAGFYVYNGNIRKSGDCAQDYKTCMLPNNTSQSYVGEKCFTPNKFLDLSSITQSKIKKYCSNMKGKIVEKLWNNTTFNVFDGLPLTGSPVFDQRVGPSGVVTSAYCSINTATCDNKSNLYVGQLCENDSFQKVLQ